MKMSIEQVKRRKDFMKLLLSKNNEQLSAVFDPIVANITNTFEKVINTTSTSFGFPHEVSLPPGIIIDMLGRISAAILVAIQQQMFNDQITDLKMLAELMRDTEESMNRIREGISIQQAIKIRDAQKEKDTHASV